MPTGLPLVRRRCPTCGPGRFRASGRFRANANHKLIDAWLLVRCTGCGVTAKLTVLVLVLVRSLRAGLLERLQDNDPGLVAELLRDPRVLRRNRVGLDWDGAWRLDAEYRDRTPVTVSVRFAAPIPVRPVRLIAEARGLSRAEVHHLITAGKLVSTVRLTAPTANTFTFILKP